MIANHAKTQSIAALPCPIAEEVPFVEPASFLHLLEKHDNLAFLDSAARSPDLGRYSYLAASPFGVFNVKNGIAYWNGIPSESAPFVALNRLLQQYQFKSQKSPLPPFQGGALGYLSYEAGRLIEALPSTDFEQARIDDIRLPFYDVILAIDHFPDGTPDSKNISSQPRAWIVSSGFPYTGEEQTERAQDRLDWFRSELERAAAEAYKQAPPPPITNWHSNFSRPAYERAIQLTRDHILDGDIFQANITQRFSARLPVNKDANPLSYYRQLRAGNPAPFAAYLDCGDHAIASSSPERFITLNTDGLAESRPIKGTAPRDLGDPAHDQALAVSLQESDKDRAENIMITDLMRNDLSRVCKPHSIKVPDICRLETYAQVHHLVSSVTGQLEDGLGPVALLGASFPGGSITGAPKIRSMEIITELENTPRGVYCGCIGYIGFDGTMDTNIAIRTVTFKEDMAHFSAGGGITILSDPAAEYEETLHKASAIFKSLGTSVETERAGLELGAKVAEEEQHVK